MSDVNNPREEKPLPLFILDVLADWQVFMRSIKSSVLEWKTFIENNPDNVKEIDLKGDRLCDVIKKYNRIPFVLSRCNKTELYIEQFDIDWKIFVNACENKRERTNTNRQILTKITDLEQRAPGLQSAYVKSVKRSWCNSVANTADALENIWFSPNPGGHLDRLKKGGLKPKHKQPLIDLITSNIAEINKQISFLRCCNSETAVWFANIQWPATSKALQTEDWSGAIDGFNMMVSPMAKIRDRIFYMEQTMDALELIWLHRVNPLGKLKAGNLKPKDKQFLIDLMAPNVAKINNMLEYLRSSSDATVIRFANVEWPATCEALKAEDWKRAIDGFTIIMDEKVKGPMMKLKISIGRSIDEGKLAPSFRADKLFIRK